ncbi:hypothetical protein CAEBREN_25837 [Caenorhabditis brenneri]|uniref:Sdz-33 F-box domain-containing protein n=1 Tax=Caenorhabditis brenneri TaxID=135651 RepID=G0N425_CAEBE|nr:hypothetical protein CAEBREN_25837 [Caenorhabditis brenneri]
MSLSRPVEFPLLKLPWLCIKTMFSSSIQNFFRIYFATISNRTRRIVKISNYPLQKVDVAQHRISRRIFMGKDKTWYFSQDQFEFGVPLVLNRNSEPFLTSSSLEGDSLRSYTAGDTPDALKMGIDFMIDVFRCSIRLLFFDGDKLSELSGLGITSVRELFIFDDKPVNITDLKYLLETMKVIDRYAFYVPIPANFSCDPQIFTHRRLSFMSNHSADWVTLDLLCQLDVSVLNVRYERFSKEDIVSYVTHWFNSENRKLEYAQFDFNNPVSQEHFEIEHLNPMPFDEKRRNRCSFVRWEGTDMSSGMDILRKDGLLATFYVESTSIIFHVWHKRFPDPVQQ